MDITIKENRGVRLKPKDLFNREYGELWRMYQGDKQCDTFFITCGINEHPIMIWWNEEGALFEIAPTSEIDIIGYVQNVWVKQVKAKIKLEIELE